MAKFDILTILSLNNGNFNSGLDKSKNKSNEFKNSMSAVSSTLLAGAAAFGLGFGAMKTFQGVMSSTQTLQDNYARTQVEINAATKSFFRTIGEGDWGNFISNMDKAITSAAEYYDQMDRIENLMISLSVQDAESAVRLGELKIAYKDVNKTNEERITAIDEILTIESDLANKRKKYSKESLDALLENLNVTTKVNKERLVGFAREYENWDVLITKGTEYNQMIEDLKVWEGVSEQTYGKEEHIKKITDKLKELGSEGKKYGQIAKDFGKITNEELTLIKDNLIAAARAEAQFNENTAKNQTAKNTLLKEINDKQEKQNELLRKRNALENEKKETRKTFSKNGQDFAPMTMIDSQAIANEIELPKLTYEVEVNVEPAQQTIRQFLDENLDAINTIYGSMTTVSNAFSDLYTAQKEREIKAAKGGKTQIQQIEKEYAEKQKKRQLTQAFIGTAVAVINALQTQPFFPVGLAMGIAAGAAGAAQISAIEAQSFAGGGIVQAAGYPLYGDKVQALLNPKEMILNDLQQANLFKLINNGQMNNNNTRKFEFKIKGRNLIGVEKNEYQKQNSFK